MSKLVSLRLPDDLAEWAEGYAVERGVSRSDLLIEGLTGFREDCRSGVPEIRAAMARQSSVNPRGLAALQGVGDCPERPGELGHVWKSPKDDPLRSCVHCGLHGREPAVNFDGKGEKPDQGGGFFAESTGERAEIFSGSVSPMQSGTGDPDKAYPKGLTPAMQARAVAIVADKKRRDAEAVANGTARPGQVAGVSKKGRS